jgi:S-adenosylmethionine synthetase
MNSNLTRSFTTVEAVLSGHPDKLCDLICDSILDAYLLIDPQSTVAVECIGSGSTLVLAGEVFSSAQIDAIEVALDTYKRIGYSAGLRVENLIRVQTPQTRQPVVAGAAGDQGIMYGYACGDKSSNYLPLATHVVQSLAREIDALRKRSPNQYLPDGKVQITYKGEEIESLVISVQHSPMSAIESLRQFVLSGAAEKLIELSGVPNIYFNYNSKFYLGGFETDSGLSGRKIIMDTYCGLAPHGGGSFSGKDLSKVDRTAAYMARYVAKNIVSNEFAGECLLSLAYVFGLEEPVMVSIETGQTALDNSLTRLVNDRFDFRPRAMIERLFLDSFTSFSKTANYGHFSDPTYPWEQIVQL